MSIPSFRDLEQLSAYLDGQLPQADGTRLDARLAADPDLRRALDELRQTRLLLRRTPRRRAPRNFTLTPKMAGIRPPVPRAVPALGWASVTAILLFLCTFGSSLIGKLSFGPMAAAPMAAQATAAPATSAPFASDNGLGAGAPAATQAHAPAATQAPAEMAVEMTATPATPPEATAQAPNLMAVSQAATLEPTAASGTRMTKQPPVPTLPPPTPPPLAPLQNGLIALAALIAALALAISLAAQRRWRKSAPTAGRAGRTKEILLLLAILVLLAVAAFAVVELVIGLSISSAEKQSSSLPVEPPVPTAEAGKSVPVDPIALTPDRFSIPLGTGYVYSHADNLGHSITLQFPAGAFDQSTDVQVSFGEGAPTPEGFVYAGIGFQMYTVPDWLPLEKPVLVSMRYNETDLSAFKDESSLVLMVWNGEAWEPAAPHCAPASAYARQPESDTLQVEVCGMEGYALFAPQP